MNPVPAASAAALPKELLRPHQWVKSGLVFAGLPYSEPGGEGSARTLLTDAHLLIVGGLWLGVTLWLIWWA